MCDNVTSRRICHSHPHGSEVARGCPALEGSTCMYTDDFLRMAAPPERRTGEKLFGRCWKILAQSYFSFFQDNVSHSVLLNQWECSLILTWWRTNCPNRQTCKAVTRWSRSLSSTSHTEAELKERWAFASPIIGQPLFSPFAPATEITLIGELSTMLTRRLFLWGHSCTPIVK